MINQNQSFVNGTEIETAQVSSTLVINWHLTEVCNYRCKYCYATWNHTVHGRELIHDQDQTSALLHALYGFFSPNNPANPLSKRFSWNSVRLNLAGGEPSLYSEKLRTIVAQASDLGFEVSLISNGSNLDSEVLDDIAPKLAWLGISIDSADPIRNQAIGRIDRKGRQLNLDELLDNLFVSRQRNPQMKIKINTVVNQLNWNEDLGPLIQRIKPEKWKVLRMLPVANQELFIGDDQFEFFVDRHQSFNRILCAEDNNDMRESYLMVDPYGRFFQNDLRPSGQGYSYSKPILDVGAEDAFAEINFDHRKFASRYIPIVSGSYL